METKIVYSAATRIGSSENFTPDAITLAEARISKKHEINRDFEAQIATGTAVGYLTQSLTTNYHVYDAMVDLSNYQVAYNSMQVQGLTSRQIKVKEASPFVTVSLEDMQKIVGELVVYGDTLWVRKQDLYAQIEAAPDIATVDAIVW